MKSLLRIFVAGAFCVQAQEIDKGSAIFASRCAGCHGSDGAGGEHGPTIVEPGRRGGGAPSPQALSGIIKNGIKESGMPAFTFSDAEMSAVVAFIEALRAPAADQATSGDVGGGANLLLREGELLQLSHAQRARRRYWTRPHQHCP